MCKVTIVDACCGKGKTSWAIEHMNTNVDDRFIYITPYLDEVERVIDGCTDRYFEQPDTKKGKGSKLEDLNNLISEGKNICSTHALFKYANEEIYENLLLQGYTLILDEVFQIIEHINITKSDREILLNGKVHVDEEGKVTWLDKDYHGNLNEYRKQIEHGDVYMMDNAFLLWTFPAKIMDVFKHTYILTYLFKGQLQRYYYDMNNVNYEYKSVECVGFGDKKHYQLCEYEEHEDLSYLRELINICDNDNLNEIGRAKDKRSNPLSKSWYDNQNRKKLDGMNTLKKNMYNFFRNVCKSKAEDNMWTTFKDYQSKCKGKGYAKGFVSCNARATNEFRHKKNLAYCTNIFNNPILIKFFTSKGVVVDEDTYALGELIQWIFRSQLRDGKPINLYIPSERMRNLLKQWLGI